MLLDPILVRCLWNGHSGCTLVGVASRHAGARFGFGGWVVKRFASYAFALSMLVGPHGLAEKIDPKKIEEVSDSLKTHVYQETQRINGNLKTMVMGSEVPLNGDVEYLPFHILQQQRDTLIGRIANLEKMANLLRNSVGQPPASPSLFVPPAGTNAGPDYLHQWAQALNGATNELKELKGKLEAASKEKNAPALEPLYVAYQGAARRVQALDQALKDVKPSDESATDFKSLKRQLGTAKGAVSRFDENIRRTISSLAPQSPRGRLLVTEGSLNTARSRLEDKEKEIVQAAKEHQQDLKNEHYKRDSDKSEDAIKRANEYQGRLVRSLVDRLQDTTRGLSPSELVQLLEHLAVNFDLNRASVGPHSVAGEMDRKQAFGQDYGALELTAEFKVRLIDILARWGTREAWAAIGRLVDKGLPQDAELAATQYLLGENNSEKELGLRSVESPGPKLQMLRELAQQGAKKFSAGTRYVDMETAGNPVVEYKPRGKEFKADGAKLRFIPLASLKQPKVGNGPAPTADTTAVIEIDPTRSGFDEAADRRVPTERWAILLPALKTMTQPSTPSPGFTVGVPEPAPIVAEIAPEVVTAPPQPPAQMKAAELPPVVAEVAPPPVAEVKPEILPANRPELLEETPAAGREVAMGQKRPGLLTRVSQHPSCRKAMAFLARLTKGWW